MSIFYDTSLISVTQGEVLVLSYASVFNSTADKAELNYIQEKCILYYMLGMIK
jgi:hypothetical protein